MAKTIQMGARKRLDFSRIPSEVANPNLLDVQRESYRRFLQMKALPEERSRIGLQEAFSSIFPIEDFRGECSLHFVDYTLGDWECRCGYLKGREHLRQLCDHCGHNIILLDTRAREIHCPECGRPNELRVERCPHCEDPVGLKEPHSEGECREQGRTYGVPLNVRVRLEVYEKDEKTGDRSIRDIKEENVFFGIVPLMTSKGTFLINGSERVVVSHPNGHQHVLPLAADLSMVWQLL